MNQDFTKRILSLAGDAGKEWLEKLPTTIQFYEKKWSIKCSDPFPLSYNYVLPAVTESGKEVVLKIGFPTNDEFENEIEALQFYQGIGAIHVIETDINNKVALLERATPGTRIGDVSPDRKQISFVTEVIAKIHKPISEKLSHSLPHLSDWAKAFERYRLTFDIKTGPIPTKMFEEAEEIFTQLPKDNLPQVLLHGDLHNDNILLSERGWLAIDPKGVIGEQAFEVSTYLRNPFADLTKNSDYKKVEEDRILQFAEELGIDKKRIQKWTFANAIISLLWFLEDESTFNDIYLRNAELVASIDLGG